MIGSDNDTRRRIFERVKARPGQSIAQIAGTVGVSHSTTSYHLDRLVEFRLLVSTQDGNKTRFFVDGGAFTLEERRILSALSNAQTRRVLAAILASPGSYRAELAAALRVSSPTVHWHLQRLLGAGLVAEAQRGSHRCLFSDSQRLRGALATLTEKVRGTEFDGSGLRALLDACGPGLSTSGPPSF